MGRRVYVFLAVIMMILCIYITREWLFSDEQGEWVGAWSTSMQAPFTDGISQEGFDNQTIRSIIQPHIDGKKMRIRLSNEFGSSPIIIDEIQVAVSKNEAETIAGTDRNVTFGGAEKITIPPGGKLVSDPVSLKVNRMEELAVSMFVRKPTGPATWHPLSIQETYISASGNHVSDSSASAFTKKEEAWFWVDGVDVMADSSVKGSIVVMGSSIANGNYSTVNADHRWPDYLAQRMNQESEKNKLSVLNAGVSGNHLINSGSERGENALARLERDVFNETAVTSLIFHQGLNDIRHYPEYGPEKIIQRIKEIIHASHEKGIKIYGATLTPYKGSSMYTKEGEKTRQAVNDWIRNSGAFDGMIDFDKAMRDPNHPKRYLPEYDSGDHLHPNDLGYKKMAESIELSMFFENHPE
ncbi:SGNH/GDSL hydrolase family protein [Halobacillus halophilus]|uniref:SGNH/GDSL hydrolase family protein n=1 Tax=Halobacillus halophilus TaxID=1570 RepID=UPI001CD598D3|nr:SGNH/GDSL hydrolase family protein [Halobacillus halophilus]MCA1011985.1 SGNH/GDSL hydrolase family protein [Halobacillus halophilus]